MSSNLARQGYPPIPMPLPDPPAAPAPPPQIVKELIFDATNVYALIAAVQKDIAKDGIAKDRKNAQQGYSFRGIDDVYNALAPILATHQLVILPRILSRECVERTSKSGSAQFFVVVEAEFDFVSALCPESRHTVRTFGEAQDSGDKATNKAMSAAYKYAAFQTFCIPTEGDHDSDNTTPEPTQPTPHTDAIPTQHQDNWTNLVAVADEGTAAFNAAWEAMSGVFKNYVVSHRKDAHNELKARAARVTAGKR
jgi:hypothetical protein